MKSNDEIKKIAIKTIEEESISIKLLSKNINDNFIKTIELILNSKGRVIVTGIGKSAIIASKIVATFNSTGTPAIFMHAADAIHGDLGIIRKEDIIICLSKSGNTSEIKVLAPFLKNMGNKLIALVGNTDSYLAHHADLIIDTTVQKEAGPDNLAPTSSTTAQLVMGDALAVCLYECRGFTAEDFAKYHPGGSLGKQLYLKVSDLYINNESPMVTVNDNIKQIIMEISSKRLGATAVLDGEKLVGIITDGDLRRMLQKDITINDLSAKDIMTLSPKTIEEDVLAVDALQVMRNFNITQILVVRNKQYVGVVHLHDILKEGIL